MSRLWNRPRLCVYVGADHLALCQVAGRWSPRVLDKARVALPDGEEQSWWQSLEAWLAIHPLQGVMQGADLECVLGLPHVRYLLLPWDPQLVNAGFRDAVARALFARQFQETAGVWEVRYASSGYGQPRLAAFVRREVLSALERLVLKHGLRLRAVEPLLAVVWRRFRSQLPLQGENTLLVAEPGRVLRITHERGAMTDVQVRPCTADELPGLLLRAADEEGARVFSPASSSLAGSLPAAWLQLQDREGWTASDDGAYAYALCGVR